MLDEAVGVVVIRDVWEEVEDFVDVWLWLVDGVLVMVALQWVGDRRSISWVCVVGEVRQCPNQATEE